MKSIYWRGERIVLDLLSPPCRPFRFGRTPVGGSVPSFRYRDSNCHGVNYLSLNLAERERITPGVLPSAPSGPTCGRSESLQAIRSNPLSGSNPSRAGSAMDRCYPATYRFFVWRRERDYSGRPALRPFGADLRSFRIAPGDSVKPSVGFKSLSGGLRHGPVLSGYVSLLCMAEREGFEPSMGDKPHTPLAGERLQPLGHLSFASAQGY